MIHASRTIVARFTPEEFLNHEAALKGVDKEAIDEWDGFFIADSGATTHMVGSDVGMYNCEIVNDKIKVGNGQYITAKKKGKI